MMPKGNTMSKLTRTTLTIEEDLLTRFDQWMSAHGYDNRSKALRDVIRQTLVEELWANPDAIVVASLSIIYDHAAHALSQELANLQHEDHHAVLCSQHVHLDHDNCLEVILLKGKSEQLRRICDAIVTTRGVRAGKLTMMSTAL